MSLSLNRAQLIGNLAHDPEMKQTANGRYITSMVVVTNKEWTTQDGQKQSKADFHKVAVFGKFAETCANYLHKGDRVYVEGTIETNEWEDQNGNKKSKTEIIAKNVLFLTTKKREDQGGYDSQYSQDF